MRVVGQDDQGGVGVTCGESVPQVRALVSVDQGASQVDSVGSIPVIRSNNYRKSQLRMGIGAGA